MAASAVWPVSLAMTDMAWIPIIPFRARLVWLLITVSHGKPNLSRGLVTHAKDPAKSSVEIWLAGYKASSIR